MPRFIPILLTALLLLSQIGWVEAQLPTKETLSATCSQTPRPSVRVSTRTLEGLLQQLKAIEEAPCFFRPTTDPIFYFENLPGVPFKEGKELAAEHRAQFEASVVEVADLMRLHADVDVYDEDDCATEIPGHWVQISPFVQDPRSGDMGAFIRVTPGPCLPLGGRRYWAKIESRQNPKVIEFVDLEVTEF